MASPSDHDNPSGRPSTSRINKKNVVDLARPGLTWEDVFGKQTPSLPPTDRAGIWSDDRFSQVPAAPLTRGTGDSLPSGSGTLTASSEAEPPYQWPRNITGNSSPNRQRTGPALHTSPYAQPPASKIAIGQHGPVGASSSQISQAFNEHSRYSNHPDTSTLFSQRSSGSGFRGSQNSQYPAVPTRSSGFSNLEANAIPGGHQFVEPQYGSYSTHSQRPSNSGVDHSHRGFGNAPGFNAEDSELSNRLNGMALHNTTEIPNGMATRPGSQSSQPSQLNPSSRPWDNAASFLQDHQDAFGYDRRSTGFGRNSPVGVHFYSQGSSSGTPQPGFVSWTGPESRNHRNAVDSGQAPMPRYLQGQPQQYRPVPYGNPSLYHPYPAPYDNFVMPVNRTHHVPASRHSRELELSPLLQEYHRSTKPGRHRQWELRDISGHVVEFCGDQLGSRFIQAKLPEANSDEKLAVRDEILPDLIAISKDIFGNYVVQKLFETSTQAQKKILADSMRGHVLNMSLTMYGCRVVQHVLENTLIEQRLSMARELEPEIIKVMKDVNGNHVVSKVIHQLPREHIGFIYDVLKGRVGELSCHGCACRIVQRALEKGTADDQQSIVAEIQRNLSKLVTDGYGNYVVQHVIQHGDPKHRSDIIAHVTSRLQLYSRNKCASNVVEQCIMCGTDEERRHIVEKLVGKPGVEDADPQGVMKDSFGNYVVQKLLKTLEGSELAALKETLKPHIAIIKRPPLLNQNTLKHIKELESLVFGPSTSPTPPTPASPGLQGNAGSTVPTPNLTTEPNSPSSNPPSTKASSVGDGEHQTNGKLTGEELKASVTVQVRDDGC